MKDHLRHMLLFRTLVEKGSLTAAAEHLQLSKSVLSQHLKSLEEAVGVQLLQRTTRKQNLTPAGRAFYRHCCQIQQQVEIAWQQAQSSSTALSGQIRITAPHALMDGIVAPAVAQLLLKYPKIEPDLVVDDQQVDIVDQEIDLAIRVGKMPSSNLRQRRLGQFSELLVAHPDYLARVENSPVSLHSYIANIWEGHRVSHQINSQSGNDRVHYDFDVVARANNIHGVLALTKAGVGVACIPDFLLCNEDTLVPLLEGFAKPAVPVFAVHAYQHLPVLVDLAIQEVEGQLQNWSERKRTC